MRCFASTILLALLLTTIGRAQGAGQPRHPDDPSATFVGSFRVAITNSPSDQKGLSPFSNEATGVSLGISIWRVSGRTDYYIDPDSITFNGDDAWVDAQSTGQLFDLMAHTAISQGLAQGFATCSSECGLVNLTTRVYAPACVRREGHGSATTFKSCGLSAFSMREYLVCCPNGIEAPLADLVFKINGGLCLDDNYCEATCP